MGRNQITRKVFSPWKSYHKIQIWSTNVQTRYTWKTWHANLRNFWAKNTIGAQHSHLHHVLLPVLPSTTFVTTSLLLARSLTEFHKQLELLFFSVQSRVYGYKPNFLKLVILSISDSVPDEGRDLLEDILPNEMIRKLNLILCL